MFETITDNDERGQVGIGTLIVFIAMVLVAAIAAGVLINTAGDLQSQASDTGSETQEQVANQIEVVHAVGEKDSPEDNISELNLTVMKSAGSDVIDLESMTVQYTSSSVDETLTYDAENNEADDSEFATHSVYGTNSGSLTNAEDRVAVVIDVDALEEDGLGGGDSATIRLVDQSGAQFSYGVSVPSTIDDRTVVEV
ncbi:archaellin/type IV pilin N-terminal domain-containing protein [Natronolimnohabitans innermongolicus]|uniref:Flagellin n=1 Tax=Natronolimnohabitans innermongolicus JCM 12255 TaxID=1227499 RepID=L9WUQ3_9EURY|nr:archaellin/type IV pilin N-terminal domain-containing protein [Natronolimnohabitans innermongolicus]ELY53219.1 flagellin [Natronolimnohabitans innermongolicus JCM 12255]